MKNQVIFRIYDDQIDAHFYMHWNTFTQLPISLPLDLVTFIDYLMFEGIDLDIVCNNWENLQTHGSTIPNYKPRLSHDLKFYLRQVAIRTEVVEWTENNRNLVEKYEYRLNLKLGKKAMITMLRNEHQALNFRHVYALRCLDYTYQNLLKYLPVIRTDHPHFDLDEFMETLISSPMLPDKMTSFFQKLTNGFNFPIEAVPHINRMKGDFDSLGKEHIYGLLEYRPSLNEGLELVKVKSTKDDKIKILNTLCFHYAEDETESLKANILKANDDYIRDLSVKELNSILKKMPFNADYHFNLKTKKDKLYLPVLFESVEEVNDQLIVFKRFGVSQYDLYTTSGVCLESTSENISIYSDGYYLVQQADSAILKRYDSDRKLKYVVFEELAWKAYELEANPEQQILLFDGVLYFYNEQEISPNCFTNLKHLGEDYVSVCKNGLWGYAFLRPDMELAVECQYGYAGPFIGDYALVYDLEPNYKQKKGVWVDLYSWIPIHRNEAHRQLNPYKFEFQHPHLEREHSLPVKLLDESMHKVDYIEEYHYFGFSTSDLRGLGRWLVIDKEGKTLFQAQPDESLELLENGVLKVKGPSGILIYDLNTEGPKLLETESSCEEHCVSSNSSLPLTEELGELDQAKLSNPKYAHQLLKLNPDFYSIISNELKDDFEFALNAALYIDVNIVYSNSSRRLKKDMNFIKQLLCISTDFFLSLPKKIKDNDELINFALSRNYTLIMSVKDTFPNYKELMVQAIQKDASNFIKLPDIYKVDMEFVANLMIANPEVGKYLTSFHLDIKYLKEVGEKIGPKFLTYFPKQTSSELI